MHIFTPTYVGVFWVKMCKMKGFFLQDFASIDVNALTGVCFFPSQLVRTTIFFSRESY